MESRKMKTYKTAIIALALMILGSSVYAANGYAVMIQQSPAGAGQVTPGGVHRYGLNESISIQAVPKPGYKFVQWLGDVTESSMTKTTIVADSPKIVIALFEQDKFPEFKSGGGGGSAVAGGSEKSSNLPGRTVSNAVSVSAGGSVNAASSGSYDTSPFVYNSQSSGSYSPFYVPGRNDNDNNVPEPATLLILSLGSVAILRKR